MSVGEFNRQSTRINKAIIKTAEKEGVALKTDSVGRKTPLIRKSGVFVDKEAQEWKHYIDITLLISPETLFST